MMHHSYVIPDLVDAAKMREDAAKRLRDKRHPEETIVHYHKVGQSCTVQCEEYRFENEVHYG